MHVVITAVRYSRPLARVSRRFSWVGHGRCRCQCIARTRVSKPGTCMDVQCVMREGRMLQCLGQMHESEGILVRSKAGDCECLSPSLGSAFQLDVQGSKDLLLFSPYLITRVWNKTSMQSPSTIDSEESPLISERLALKLMTKPGNTIMTLTAGLQY
jgi:hypothetical protein